MKVYEIVLIKTMIRKDLAEKESYTIKDLKKYIKEGK